jgi:hypothetical protein
MPDNVDHKRDDARMKLNIVVAESAEDLWAGYDPEALRAAVEATAGSWADVDCDALIREIYEARERTTDRFDPSWADEVWGNPEPAPDLEAEWLGQWDEL